MQDPAAVHGDELKPVVQAIGSALPEFDRGWHYTVSAPMRRAGDLSVLINLVQVRELLLEEFPVRYDVALRRGPCAELAFSRATLEVRFGFGS